jgi:hypothetical protein
MPVFGYDSQPVILTPLPQDGDIKDKTEFFNFIFIFVSKLEAS